MSHKYDSPHPCASCPFGRGPESLRHLRHDRLLEICHAGGFTCHKTSKETGDGTERECAGHMIFKVATGGSTQMMRIAGRMGWMSEEVWDEIHDQAEHGETVITDLFELVEAHESGETG